MREIVGVLRRRPAVVARWMIFLVFFASGSPEARGATDTEAGGSDHSDEYVIGPTDVLDVQVWNEPNLSRTIPVRPDGKITLPLLDDVTAAGLTPLRLKGMLEKALAKFLETPRVSVSIQEINSKNIYILGQVETPGEYPLRQRMRVLQALSLAGGFAEWADKGGIVIVREVNGEQHRIPFDYDRVSKGKDLDRNILLWPGDTIIVP
jgi:polysaccharide export outer membrane protein